MDANSEYLDVIRGVFDRGEDVVTRNSRCRRTFAHQCRFDRFPLVSYRKTAWKTALREWEWFMSGSNRLEDLHPSVRPWWQPWAKHGYVPHNYSRQFRNFYGANDGVDQVQLLIDGVRDHPFSRRNVITTWNTADMVDLSCPITNCHGTVIQAFVSTDDKLHLVTYQRSADVICGLPHNWVQYWAFLVWMAHQTGRLVGTLTWIGGDVHIYEAHAELALRIRKGYIGTPQTPGLLYAGARDTPFRADDFSLDGSYLYGTDERAEMVV